MDVLGLDVVCSKCGKTKKWESDFVNTLTRQNLVRMKRNRFY